MATGWLRLTTSNSEIERVVRAAAKRLRWTAVFRNGAKTQAIIELVGPMGCGKSHFLEQIGKRGVKVINKEELHTLNLKPMEKAILRMQGGANVQH